jgi:hypothetical protein
LIKELIHEEFGDGIMSAIDFSMNISREADPKATASKSSCQASFCPIKLIERAPRPEAAGGSTRTMVVRPANQSQDYRAPMPVAA